jgi:hypothetical protein
LSSLTWTWYEFWNWFEGVKEIPRKVEILKQLDADFVRGVSWEIQVDMFSSAPLEIVENIKSILKPQAFEFIIKERHKQMRKRRK